VLPVVLYIYIIDNKLLYLIGSLAVGLLLGKLLGNITEYGLIIKIGTSKKNNKKNKSKIIEGELYMNNITVTEKYALCMLKEVKDFRYVEISSHLIVSTIIEMLLEDCLEIVDYNNGKFFDSVNKIKVKLSDKEPANEYNKKLYKIIREMNKPEVSIQDIISTFYFGLSNKKLKTIIQALKERMVKDELISIKNKKGIFGTKEILLVNNDKFNLIIEEIRTKFLNEGSLDDDLILLASLLNSTNFLKNVFIKYEKETLKKRLEEIKNTEISQNVKIAQYIINVYVAAIT